MNGSPDLFASLDDEPVPPLAIPAEIEAEFASLTPVRMRRPRRQLVFVVGSALAYASVVLAALAIRRDIGELPLAWLVGVALLWSGSFAAAIYFVLVPPRRSVMARWQIAIMIAASAAVGFVALGLLLHPSGPSSVTYGWERFVHGHGCLEIGLGVAIVPTVLGALCLRRTKPTNARLLAAALGAGGGCLGGLVLHFFCRITDGPHVGLIHGGVVGVAMLLASLLAVRLIEPRD